jgi:hypothetical protein
VVKIKKGATALASYTIRQITFAGISSLLLMTLAFYLKLTNGLFLPRLPWDFLSHRNDPKYELERQNGKKFSAFVFTYVPPLLVAFLILFLLTYIL